MRSFIVMILLVAVVVSCAKDPFRGEDYEAGLLEVEPGDEMFYWLLRSRSRPNKDPLVVWLSGGPGCSSLVALFYENGPWTINEDLSLKTNPYSWNEAANVLYVDQPLGTGFSTTTNPDHYATNKDELAETFYKFIVKFMEKHPEYKKRAFYITGESYAGHMIPAISSHFIKKNNTDINLKSVAIGNGWVKPVLQYPAYREYAHENKLIGEIDNKVLYAGFWACKQLINFNFKTLAYKQCQHMLMYSIGGGTDKSNFNFYDIRKKCDHPPLCYDMSGVDKLLAKPEIQELLGVNPKSTVDPLSPFNPESVGKDATWKSCRLDIQALMLGDWTNDSSVQVRDTLENGVGVFVYNGDQDYACNWRGSEDWTSEVFWEHKDCGNGYKCGVQNWMMDEPYQKWVVDGKEAGEFKKVDNFSFLKVYQAGHMVPMDQPRNSLVMFKLFLNRAF
ncbi:unnamed protein product [Moneuplotes crassus]|uniref:Carboxypeptidase n=1 Tax=Euplotes crassus TaxID=5936 RepID=A0AAD1XF82_EUPCR|nr:unnamed protein product [Moneuplotes crassus]